MDFLKEEESGTKQPEPKVVADSEISLADYLKAGYSFLHVRTEEDYRAKEAIKAAYTAMGELDNALQYWEWSSTKGLEKFTEVADITPATSDMVAIPDALESVITSKHPVICTFYNIRQFVEMPMIVQKFKDAAEEARLVGSTIFLVGPQFDYPMELDKEITVWDLELPTSEHFYNKYSQLAVMYEQDIGEVPEDTLRIAAASAVGMTELQGENSVALSIVKKGSIDSSLIQKEKEQIIKKSDVLEFVAHQDGMDMVGGFDIFKDWIKKRRIAYSEEAREFGLKPPKGILLVGVPGTGKSLISKTLSHYLKLPLIRFDMGKVFRGLQGGSEHAVRNALKTIEAVAPNVVWIDEIEKATAGTQSSGKTDGGTTARVMGTVLSWMQENTKPIFICATANNPSSLPAELLRKGRFSEIWGVPEPNEKSRREIWQIHVNKVRSGLDVDYDALVAESKGYVGAEIEAIIEEAMFDAYNDNKSELSTEYLIKSVQKVIPQSETSKDSISTLKDWMQERVRFVESPEATASIFDVAGGRKLKLKKGA